MNGFEAAASITRSMIGFLVEGGPKGVYICSAVRPDCFDPPLYISLPSRYKIKDGDTLTRIAKKFHISVQRLAEFNGIKNVHLIRAKDIITIPDFTG